MKDPLIRFAEEARQETGIDPQTVVEAHHGDPAAIIAAWTDDRARLMAKLDSVRHSAARYREDRDSAWAELENAE
ncbi:hypothetical protein ACIRPH_31365 [Nocardiopsis sp. NPDC101807]|uniref:hypothetical protein n=1 Tax=Nocardiopsis sp. NPDC101807 TaxID=3364339 RepID=UPI0037FE2D61